MSDDNKGTFETWTEEMTVAGGELVDTMKSLLQDASVHRLQVINNRTGDVVVDIPAALGLPAAIFLNIWLVLGALILYVADFNIVIERRVEEDADDSVADKIVVHEEVAEEAEEVVKEAPAATGAEIEQCQGTTKSGSQCKRKPMEGSAYCYAHQPE